MRALIQLICWLALAGLVIAPILYYAGTLSEPWLRHCLLATTMVWFAAAPFQRTRAPSS